jgi:hypothetical protein
MLNEANKRAIISQAKVHAGQGFSPHPVEWVSKLIADNGWAADIEHHRQNLIDNRVEAEQVFAAAMGYV